MDKSSLYILRTIDLALQSDIKIKFNPPVGCIIVKNDKIIGEGYHREFGKAHAEVNATQDAMQHGFSVQDSDYYVSLEPCGHYGNTPPCSKLIAENRAKNVYFYEDDPNPITAGKGEKILSESGIKLHNIQPAQQSSLIDRFYINQIHHRPKVILKFAQTADGKMGSSAKRIIISNPISARLVHRWRSECDGILIGSGTLEMDDPILDNRLWFGESPHRFVIGGKWHKHPASYKLFNDGKKSTWLNTGTLHEKNIDAQQVVTPVVWDNIWKMLYQSYGITNLLVEGGSQVLNSIIEQGAFDEIRTITSSTTIEEADIKAPTLKGVRLIKEMNLSGDQVTWYSK
ncbi:MAG: bifunctional diaminohydroxyphosphoribosylaminopyrimidine deaminase/5-amino-6-(5-phosphoribosylamino)uracil reductase RibD [Saprospiraceae bacterium]|nr:bifunctional diaminohydroxyphosphoribosylaminopyrimidine deaminase/5-amino-6-(5-phosphoribosylamino)uracil reductase RibD [Saprospiraceae bacterium]